ncbi:transmembrane 9 superfamily member 1-like protein [Tanacetum coccineum]
MSSGSHSAGATAIPKFDMHTFTSGLTVDEVNNIAEEYGIPLDLRPRVPSSTMTMDNLPFDVIGIYEQYLEMSLESLLVIGSPSNVSGKGGHDKIFNEFCLSLKNWKDRFFFIDRRAIPDAMPWTHHDSSVSDPPPIGVQAEDVRRLCENVIDLRPIHPAMLYEIGLTTIWKHVRHHSAFKDGEGNDNYQSDDKVTLWVNKVGPYNNPQETYNFYSLPFCRQADHAHAAHKWGGLGEVLGGNELIDSQMEVKFQKNVEKTTICELELDEPKVMQFKQAIENNYWFELFMGFVGELHSDRNTDSKHMLFTHMNITIQYNKDQIIHVNLTQENPKSLEVGKTLDMTYSVTWTETNVTYARRFDVYLDYHFFEHQIHWFSIFNSFMMVIFLTGLVSMILMRTLRNDYAKYAREDDDLETLERDVSEESGWKLVHGDVFRPPRNLVLLSAVVGTGAQLALLILLVILFAIIGMLYVGYAYMT